MQTRPDQPTPARHARLFELLRQENLALRARMRKPVLPDTERAAATSFLKTAERSFFQGHPTL